MTCERNLCDPAASAFSGRFDGRELNVHALRIFH
jgi:hypothetical protein